ncbi:MAG: tRNA (adenosine(37)-N6)-dimethylallyltransferase MiaA [Alloprevotella sp.]|nr:tRNA (adenosine(37)-N6)-dimethylallyltransferase MiaA [Alloprevotella sp.]
MKTLVVLLGPTGVGKTELSLELAERLQTPILNADSRQIYRDIPIGTAAPTQEQLRRVKHYFVGTLALDEYYSAARYEEDAIRLLEQLFERHDVALMSGGSMLYIDAICKGIDDMPSVDAEVRTAVRQRYADEGLDPLLSELKLLDPIYYKEVDPRNTQRVIHALEICYATGRPFSSYRTHSVKERPFRIVKIGLNRPRGELFERINARVGQMLEAGWMDEVRRVLPYRACNSLNTVGYKELFRVVDNEWTLDFARQRIAKNTRVYAKKQLTWFAKDETILWHHPVDKESVMADIDRRLSEA